MPETGVVDPGLARLWAAIVAFDPPQHRPARLASRHRCALRQL